MEWFALAFRILLVFSYFFNGLNAEVNQTGCDCSTSAANSTCPCTTTLSAPAPPIPEPESQPGANTDTSKAAHEDSSPSVAERQFTRLAKHTEQGSLSMYECVKHVVKAEICKCEWLIHQEEGSTLNADIRVSMPEQPHEDDEHGHCHHCYVQYGSLHDDYKLIRDKRCDLDTRIKFTTTDSMWLEFNCVGPTSHHALNWTRVDGTKYIGLSVNYSVTESQAASTSGFKWELSNIFTLAVMVLSVIAIISIAFVVYRSCRGQSIQRNILQTRQPDRLNNSRLRKLLNRQSLHKGGLHELFVAHQELMRSAKKVSSHRRRVQYSSRPPAIDLLSLESSTEYDTVNENVMGIGKVKRKAPARPAESLPHHCTTSARYTNTIPGVRSDHTYISILHQMSSDQDADLESNSDAVDGPGRSKPAVKSVSQHFLATGSKGVLDNKIAGAGKSGCDATGRRFKQTKSHHNGADLLHRKKRKIQCRANKFKVTSSGTPPSCVLDSADSLQSYKKVDRDLPLEKQNSASSSSERSVVLKVTEPSYERSPPHATADSLETREPPAAMGNKNEPKKVPQSGKKKSSRKLSTPLSDGSLVVTIPHIVLTRASTKHKRRQLSDSERVVIETPTNCLGSAGYKATQYRFSSGLVHQASTVTCDNSSRKLKNKSMIHARQRSLGSVKRLSDQYSDDEDERTSRTHVTSASKKEQKPQHLELEAKMSLTSGICSDDNPIAGS